jgi:hypothetical protein
MKTVKKIRLAAAEEIKVGNQAFGDSSGEIST